MKRIKVIGLAMVLAMGMMACGSQADNEEAEKEAEIVTAETLGDFSSEDDTEEADSAEDSEILADSSVDLDLTSLSSTLIYAEVSNMMMEPLEYEGKTVKMEGICGTYQDPNTGKKYYACIIQDATQCCAQGREFVLDDDKYTESDYPAQGEEITVKGTFATYQENGGQYLTMLDSQLLDE